MSVIWVLIEFYILDTFIYFTYIIILYILYYTLNACKFFIFYIYTCMIYLVMSSYIFEYLTYLYGLHIYKLIITYLNVLHRCMFVTNFLLKAFALSLSHMLIACYDSISSRMRLVVRPFILLDKCLGIPANPFNCLSGELVILLYPPFVCFSVILPVKA